MLPYVLARAESIDPTVSNLSTVLVCALIVLVAGAFGFVPVLIAWARRSKHSEAITALAMLWGLGATLSVASTAFAQMKYSHDHEADVMSGYLDPRDATGAPTLPWVTWTGLGAGYVALLAWPLLVPGRLPE
ncbi:MAG TPA: hypothetical protein VLJ39_08150 [Tepidisphaeraceae bacterium]|nr:hypothetical protein [Tepidisphaeraceae bacterium]